MEDLEGQEAMRDVERPFNTLEEIRDALKVGEFYYVYGIEEPLEFVGSARVEGCHVRGGFRVHSGRNEATLGASLAHPFILAQVKSSSNETTEPPAKEKYSALKNFSVVDDGISNEELRQRLSDAVDTLIEQHNALYDACEKALEFFNFLDARELYPKFAGPAMDALAAALTKAGKK